MRWPRNGDAMPDLEREWQRHLSVIADQKWPDSEKEWMRDNLRRVLDRDGHIDHRALTHTYRWNLCAARLKDGIFTDWDGWAFRSDWAITFWWDRHDLPVPTEHRVLVPKWNLKPVKRLVVLGEQGVGDEILFASVLPELIVRLGHDAIEFQCYPKLQKVFARSFRIACTPRQPLGAVIEGSAVVALGDLLPLYRRNVAHFPRKPFLKPDPERVAYWRGWLAGYGDSKKIGLAWYSRHGWLNPADLMTDPDAVYFNLQYPDADLPAVPIPDRLVNVPFNARDDLDELCSFVVALDCVVAVTQTLVHIAGAVGQECQAIIPPKNGQVTWFLWYYYGRPNCVDHWPHLIYPTVTVFNSLDDYRNHSRPG
jgi:hypothetical protein